MVLVSICIPTRNRIVYLKKTVESIISDGVSISDYEIVISDNSDDNETSIFCEELIAGGVNVKYYRNPQKGFYNSIKALTLGNGHFLKLQNDYSKFLPGAFRNLVDLIRSELVDKPTIFFSNGTLKLNSTVKVNGKNRFIKVTNYQNTWSSAFAIWKTDLDSMRHDPSVVDEMFPHTSLLFDIKKENYIIDDHVYMQNISVERKGGYNIFYNFCILYLNMLEGLVQRQEISLVTYWYVKYKMLISFITPWYFWTVLTDQGYTFDCSNADVHIKKKYGVYGVLFVKLAGRVKKMLGKYCG